MGIVVRKKGTPARHLLGSAAPLYDLQGCILGAVCIMHDIMPPKIAADAIRETEERFRIMADGCPSIMWVTSQTKIIMATALDDIKTVMAKELCDAYVVKPVDGNQLLGHLRTFGLIPEPAIQTPADPAHRV